MARISESEPQKIGLFFSRAQNFAGKWVHKMRAWTDCALNSVLGAATPRARRTQLLLPKRFEWSISAVRPSAQAASSAALSDPHVRMRIANLGSVPIPIVENSRVREPAARPHQERAPAVRRNPRRGLGWPSKTQLDGERKRALSFLSERPEGCGDDRERLLAWAS
jgi:hypothetical protein